MGESYLQRKLFNRLKKVSSQAPQSNHDHQYPRPHRNHQERQLQIRSKTATSLCSQTSNKLIQQTSGIIATYSESSTRQQAAAAAVASQSKDTANPSPVPSSSSAPIPLNMMIRQHSEVNSLPFPSSSNLNDEPIEICNQNLGYPTIANDDDDDDDNDGDGDDDEDEEDDDDDNSRNKIQSARKLRAKTVDSSAATTSNPAKRSRLKSVTRAILYFRKPKASFGGGSTRSTRSSSISNQSSSHQLNRQSTNDSSWSQNISSSSPNFQANNQGQQQQQHQHHKTSSCGLDLPQFIVPKMNALRLPLVCLIKSLNGELMREVFVHRYELGEYLMENLKVSFGLNDCKYFGLKFAKTFNDQEDLRNNWLDLNESVCKQIKANKSNVIQVNNINGNGNNGLRSIDFYLRIKFYPPNLTRVQDSFLRNYLWLQLRRDLRLGKLTSSMNNLTLLMACVLQYELGDHAQQGRNERVRPPSSGSSSLENNSHLGGDDTINTATAAGRFENYPLEQQIADLNILPNQDLIEEQAMELWRTRLAGMRQYQAQMQFLRAAVILETYGFDYYPVRDHQRQRAYLLGFNYAGIKTIRNGRIAHHFRWHNISKISYERRMIIFHIYPNENSKRKQILGFKCLSNEDCQNLYMRLLEQKYFFTVDLAYFDKSVRRPSYLCESQSDSLLDWSSLAAPSTISSGAGAGACLSNDNVIPASIAISSKNSTQLDHSNAGYHNAVEQSNEASFESFNVAGQQLQQQQELDLELELEQHERLTQQNRPIGQALVDSRAAAGAGVDPIARPKLGEKPALKERQTLAMAANKQSPFSAPYSSPSPSSNIVFPTSQVTKILGAEQAPSLERCSLGKVGPETSGEASLSRYTDSICTQCFPTTSSRPVNFNVSSIGAGGHSCEFEEGLEDGSNANSLNEGRERYVAATTGSSFSSPPFNRKLDQASSTHTRNILQRQQSTMQYESSFAQPSSLTTTTNLGAHQGSVGTDTNVKDRFCKNGGGSWTLSGMWLKVPSSLRAVTSSGNHEQQAVTAQQTSNASTNYQFLYSLIEFAESILIEPVASIQQHSHNSVWRTRGGEGRRRGSGSGGQQDEQEETVANGVGSGQNSRIFLPAIRLCLLILLIDMMLRVSENLSNTLIDLFTFGACQNNPSLSAATSAATATTSHAMSHHSDF